MNSTYIQLTLTSIRYTLPQTAFAQLPRLQSQHPYIQIYAVKIDSKHETNVETFYPCRSNKPIISSLMKLVNDSQLVYPC